MSIVAQILKTKPDQAVHAVTPATSVYDALTLMADKNIGALLVMEGETLGGIVTERDYARKIALMGRASKDTPVSAIMTSRVLCVGPERTSQECMALMTENRLRHLPVREHARITGVISIGDLVKDIIAEQQFTIEQLEHYIAGDR